MLSARAGGSWSSRTPCFAQDYVASARRRTRPSSRLAASSPTEFDCSPLGLTTTAYEGIGRRFLDRLLDVRPPRIAAAQLARVDPHVLAEVAQCLPQRAHDCIVVGAVRDEESTRQARGAARVRAQPPRRARGPRRATRRCAARRRAATNSTPATRWCSTAVARPGAPSMSSRSALFADSLSRRPRARPRPGRRRRRARPARVARRYLAGPPRRSPSSTCSPLDHRRSSARVATTDARARCPPPRPGTPPPFAEFELLAALLATATSRIE